MKRTVLTALLLVTAALAGASAAEDAAQARLLRFPSVGGGKIAFTYAGDLYTVPVDGGKAERLTSDVGYEMFSRFSPDGRTIAFTAQYDGNTEVYVIPAEGGVPSRVTWSATVSRDNIGDRMGPNNIVMGWTPDGRIIYRSKQYCFSGLRGALFTVKPDGSCQTRIPVSEGGFCSFSPDGKQLAMNRMFREFRTWKYYRGGQADDIWINKVGTSKLEKISDNEAQDIFPMWVRDEIYYLSDRDSIMNVFCYNTKTKATSKLTDFDEYDCKFPSYDADWIVFENGGWIYKLSTHDKSLSRVSVTLNAEGLYARSEWVPRKGEEATTGGRTLSLSPDGKRVLVTVRGDIISLPATEGAIYNLMPSPGSMEKEAIWSPDGKNIAYISDAEGEYQIYLMDSADSGRRTRLTDFASGRPGNLSWSPDGSKLYFMVDYSLKSLDVATKEIKTLNSAATTRIRGYELSSDGRYIAMTAILPSEFSAIYIYDSRSGRTVLSSSPWYNSYQPVFSADGRYMYYIAERGYRMHYSRMEWNIAQDTESEIMVTPLTADACGPMLVKGDELGAAPQPKTSPKEGKEAKKAAPVEIDFEGIVERTEALPVKIQGMMRLHCIGDKLYYLTREGETRKFSISDLSDKSAFKGRIMDVNADSSKAIIMTAGKTYVVSVPDFKPGDKVVPRHDARVFVDYKAEWRQIFDETWRVYRDGFYVSNMVGKDWNKIHDKYAVLLPYVNHRQDLTYIIGEMISELATGHCYVTTGDLTAEPERIQTGLLGGTFSKDAKSGAFRIDHIFSGADWKDGPVSPLAQQGLGIKEGDYILEVDGQPCSGMVNICQPLVGRVGIVTALKVNSRPSSEGARIVYVKPVASESELAYYEWVNRNIAIVDKLSDGQIGYIHIPDMGASGLDMFTKLFYSQLDKKALIIDDRMNGGGNVSPMILERLQREVYRMTMSRPTDVTGTVPSEAFYGPKVCLIDKYSSSDGDLFPYGFRQLGLGPLIGMRTWGGIVGISGSQPYLDGQDVRTPFFTSYSTEGKWIIENHGVDPDIVVDINPFDDYNGRDAQLEKAVSYLLDELRNWKPLPGIPAAPVR